MWPAATSGHSCAGIPAMCSRGRFRPTAKPWPPAATTAPSDYGVSMGARRAYITGAVRYTVWPIRRMGRCWRQATNLAPYTYGKRVVAD